MPDEAPPPPFQKKPRQQFRDAKPTSGFAKRKLPPEPPAIVEACTAEVWTKPDTVMGRPRAKVDPLLVYDLASIDCTDQEMAHILRISVETLKKHFSAIIQEGKSMGNKSLRRKMFDSAVAGNSNLLIWLSKQRLGYRENPLDQEKQNINFNVSVAELPTVAVETITTTQQGAKDD